MCVCVMVLYQDVNGVRKGVRCGYAMKCACAVDSVCLPDAYLLRIGVTRAYGQ